jgi:hypothetical protein
MYATRSSLSPEGSWVVGVASPLIHAWVGQGWSPATGLHRARLAHATQCTTLTSVRGVGLVGEQ